MAWSSEMARWILARATPAPAGDKPPHYIDRGRRTRFFDRRVAARSWCVYSRAPPRPFWIPAFAGMTESVAVVYPGSEAGHAFIAVADAGWRR